MKKLYLFIFSCLLSAFTWAGVDVGPLINKVTLQLQAEQWITTKTALVYVAVNASVSDQSIGNVQLEVLDKLKKLSDKGEWHVMSFNRQLDQSGLESIQILAQARLPQADLSGLRDRAKSISKPGETFTISNVQFVPSDEELRQANSMLRNNLYAQAKAEIDILNKTYPEQKYYLYSIDFMTQPVSPAPMMNAMAMQKTMVAGASSSLPVGDKTVVQATVVIASMPNDVLQVLNK